MSDSKSCLRDQDKSQVSANNNEEAFKSEKHGSMKNIEIESYSKQNLQNTKNSSRNREAQERSETPTSKKSANSKSVIFKSRQKQTDTLCKNSKTTPNKSSKTKPELELVCPAGSRKSLSTKIHSSTSFSDQLYIESEGPLSLNKKDKPLNLTGRENERFVISRTDSRKRKEVDEILDSDSIHSSLKTSSSISGQLHIEIDKKPVQIQNKDLEDKEEDESHNEEDIDESQNEIPPTQFPTKHDVSKTLEKMKLWLTQSSTKDDLRENRDSYSPPSDKTKIRTNEMNDSVLMNDSYVFKTFSKNEDKHSKHQNEPPKNIGYNSVSLDRDNNKENKQLSDSFKRNTNKVLVPSPNENKTSKSKSNFNSFSETNDRPKRVLRARKNVNYNELEISTSHNEGKQPERAIVKCNTKTSSKCFSQKNDAIPSERPRQSETKSTTKSIFHSQRGKIHQNESSSFSQISKHKSSWQQINASYSKSKGSGITIKHNRVETVQSSISTKNLHGSDGRNDPYDFDFECKIRSREIQHFVPYKSFCSPANKSKEPEFEISQEDKHRRSKKVPAHDFGNRMNSQILCQKKISFNESAMNASFSKDEEITIETNGKAGAKIGNKRKRKTTKKSSETQQSDWRTNSPSLFYSQGKCHEDSWKSPASFSRTVGILYVLIMDLFYSIYSNPVCCSFF